MAVAGEDTERTSSLLNKEEEQTATVKIAVLSVHKKGNILKNIFLNCPPRPYSDHSPEEEGRLRCSGVAEEEEVRILIGRHPDCHIALDHPSISRFHLELRLSTSQQKLSVVDRSSVHGTWVSGTKIPPKVPVNLVDGDSLRLGASTRVYRLQWVSASRAFEMENPLAPLPEEETYQDDSSYVATEQQDFEILQSSLPEKKVEICQDHAGQEKTDDTDAQWMLEMPSAPSMTEFMSPASMKAVEDSSISSLVAPMLECFGSLFPLVGDNHTSVFASSVKEEQSQKEHLSPLSSENGMPSSLLSRRSKSKSISCLRIQTGRDQERNENSTAGIGNGEETVKETSTFSGQAEILETMHSAQIGNLNAQKEFKDVSDANKENVTPMSLHQKMEEINILGQKSLATTLSMKEDPSSKKLKQKSISVSCIGIQNVKNEEKFGRTVIDNADEEGSGEENSRVCEQVKIQDTLCRVLFDSLSEEGEDKYLFDSDKENLTPMTAHQSMKKSNTLQQNPLPGTSSAEEDLGRTLQQTSRSGSCLGILSGRSKKIIDNQIADTKIRERTKNENSTCRKEVSEEALCRVLFDDFGGQEDDKEVFDSDKENVTPMSACKLLKKSSIPLQDSHAPSFSSMQTSRSGSCLGILSGRSKKIIDNQIADTNIRERTKNENSTCRKEVSEEALCRVLFDGFGGQEEDKEVFDSDKENVTPISASKLIKKSSTPLPDSLAASFSTMQSSTLREKSRSASCLKIQFGRSKERIESTIVDCGVKDGTKKENLTFCEQAASEEMFCEVMFDSLSEQEGEKVVFDCSTENVISLSAQQNKKSSTFLQKSFAATLNTKEDLNKSRHMNSREFSSKGEGILTLEKENSAQDSGHKSRNTISTLNCEKSAKSSIKERFSISDTENMTPVSGPKLNNAHKELLQIKNSPDVAKHSSHLDKVTFTPNSVDVKTGIMFSEDKMKVEESGCSPDKENQTPEVSMSANTKELPFDVKENTCFSDKQNHTCQISRSVKPKQILSDDKIGILSSEHDMMIEDNENGCSSEKENQTPQGSKIAKTKQPVSETYARIQREIMKNRVDRIPFQALFGNSCSRTQSIICGNSTSCSDAQKHETNNYSNQTTTGVPHITSQEKKIWNIVVDTDCLLDEESRKCLQLLQGIKGTHLIIPRIVIRELDSLKRHESFFRKSTKASSILQWIEDCMENVSWWIHVQSSFEIVPVQPTPPASPQASCSNGIDDVVSKSLAFSTYGSFVEIVSPTAEDHILDCALLFRKLRNDGQLVLLSNSTTLKIKAMAEGLLCETAKEFRESLVNPFSERFLWVDSSPRGPTWSCVSEVGLFDNYYCQRPSVRTSGKAAEPARGLKLILLHNSHYRKFSSVK